jgi:DNA polymerase sliding clamp subunit (PCNA homolog)
MRVTVESADLARAMKQSVACKSSTMGVLECAALRADGGHLHIDTTDSECYLRCSIPAACAQPGGVLLPADRLTTIASGSGSIIIDEKGKLSRGRSHYSVVANPDLSLVPSFEHCLWEPVSCAAGDLQRAIASTHHCANEHDLRQLCKGVILQPGRVWASDGYRMARARLDAYQGREFQIPQRQVRRVLDALALDDASVQIGRTEGNAHPCALRVVAPNTELTVRLTGDMQFPNPESLMPDPDAAVCVIRLQRKGVMDAMRRAMPLCERGSKHITYPAAWSVDKSGVCLTDTGEGESCCEHLSDQGLVLDAAGTIRTGMDLKLALGLLAAMSCDEVVIRFTSATTAALFTEGGEGAADAATFAQVLMPVRL